ncbi:DUF2273 domain-containing protein [Bacillota bacterium LX-D]|nr:DUF2273 domain-containing protein [Bacillota bacterium LX-D]
MELEQLINVLFKHHRGKLIGILLGLFFGLLSAVLGFWKALFIAFCIFVGYYIGKRIDENKNFKSLLEKLFKE